MNKLNLPSCRFQFQNKEECVEIFDIVRKKYVILTPEEWVRQHFLHYLIHHKCFPPSLIQLEKSLRYNQLDKRSDITVYDKTGQALVLVECKAPYINITQDTFDQVARYNFTLKVKYLIVTNGISHFCCRMNYENVSYSFMEQIPVYKEL